ncbi:hypothetical protein B0H63DRAFT_450119 [Podospora didyma]|uniref:Peptidase S9 prolyl oligopeptidase catalytic domain-containing protein n=1 Tax=Podospora didyma TaxID=330526 RepID=A0AAE0U097_9PEZI|nr:hypothetical protein B0H63DRAFT_450119 [Podospora didyma]
MYPLSTDSEFSFYLAEVLSLSNGGGASTGEVLRAAAAQIIPGDVESFHQEFKILADRMYLLATQTVLAGSGYGGSQEALYHSLGVAVLARGWNFAAHEGPGQPTVIRQSGAGFGAAPDRSEVVTPAVDYLLAWGGVDGGRLALAGLSFGGSLAPIAGAREHRLAWMLV